MQDSWEDIVTIYEAKGIGSVRTNPYLTKYIPKIYFDLKVSHEFDQMVEHMLELWFQYLFTLTEEEVQTLCANVNGREKLWRDLFSIQNGLISVAGKILSNICNTEWTNEEMELLDKYFYPPFDLINEHERITWNYYLQTCLGDTNNPSLAVTRYSPVQRGKIFFDDLNIYEDPKNIFVMLDSVAKNSRTEFNKRITALISSKRLDEYLEKFLISGTTLFSNRGLVFIFGKNTFIRRCASE